MVSPIKVWRNQKAVRNLIGKTGKIVTWTFVRLPMSGFSEQAPYPIVVVCLGNHRNITAQMVDFEENTLTIGQTVRCILRRIREPDPDGVIPYGIKVTPVEKGSI